MIFRGELLMVVVGSGEARRWILAASSSVELSGDGALRFAAGVGVGWERWFVGAGAGVAGLWADETGGAGGAGAGVAVLVG